MKYTNTSIIADFFDEFHDKERPKTDKNHRKRKNWSDEETNKLLELMPLEKYVKLKGIQLNSNL